MTYLHSLYTVHYNGARTSALTVLLAFAGLVAAGCGDDGSPGMDMGPTDMGTSMDLGDQGPDIGPTPPGMFTGGECTSGGDCAAGTCLIGFERLGANEFDGSLFPGGYCSRLSCTLDEHCGDQGGCLARSDGAENVCLTTCATPTDCRDGYTCATVPGSTDTRTFCLFDEPDLCAHNAAWEQPGTCILRYAIADGGAQFQITATSAGLGNATFDVGPGEVVIRTTADMGAPTTGTAGVLCYDIRQNFRNTQGVITYTRGSAVSSTGDLLALGTLADDVLRWDTCTYSDTYGDSPSSWTPADTATGPGCLADYTSQGDVNCAAPEFICGVGNLEVGHNIQDGMWIQPLNSFELAADHSTLTMGGLDRPLESTVDNKVEIPNDSPSRTYLGFTSTLVSTTCY